MIAFKIIRSADQWRDVHPTLREILEWLVGVWPDPYMEITRIADLARVGELRAIGQSGIHSFEIMPYRAADIRTNDIAPIEGEGIVHKINSRWRYDPTRPERPVAIQHGPVRHLHVQVHERTLRRVESSAPEPKDAA